MIKVRMYPHLSELGNGESGMHTVIRKYFQHLGEFGIELVAPDATSFDLRAGHAGITGSEVDVCHLHGIYFTADYPAQEWEWHVNSRIVEAVRSAKIITVPSAWVAETFQRDMRLNPVVVPHGIDWQEWQHHEDNGGYVLWNKIRNGLDVVSNEVLDTLMYRFPETTFASTFPTRNLEKLNRKQWPDNLRLIEGGGNTPHSEMRLIVQRAGVYLSTAKETFGIGTLEATASGVPVLGWDFGGNSFLVKHGVNGYLAKPGDIEDLCNGLDYCLRHRQVLGSNGKELARAWTWETACQRVADVYQLAMVDDSPAVSVIISVYNKPPEQLQRAIDSVKAQTLQPDKIIVVDDGSQQTYTVDGCEYIRQTNSGVAVARNNGIAATATKYICCLDSDDWLEPAFLERCVGELEANRAIGIAYTGLQAYNADGTNELSKWPGDFNPDAQLTYSKKMNQIPTCCVFRRDAWERVGGYKSCYCPDGAGSEDSALWAAICSIGYTAKHVTPEGLFNYSLQGGLVHDNKEYREVDWLSMYPWAKDGLHPFASPATPKRWSHPVRQYDEPLISVIIPVGPGHEKELENALDSLEMQTFRKWEAVVVDDTQREDMTEWEKWGKLLVSYPYVKLFYTSDKHGAGVARNIGVKNARAPFVFFLDADDVLAQVDTLQKMWDAWESQEAVIYSDYLGKAVWDYDEALKEFGTNLLGYNHKQGAAIFKKHASDFNPDLAQHQPKLSNDPNMPYYHWCLVSVLVPKAWHNAIGGFDEAMETWEDVDYHWRLARNGYCFYRVAEPLILYAYHKGYRREKLAVKDEGSLQRYKNLIQYITRKYEGIPTKMCNCGKRKPIVTGATAETMSDADYVMIEFNFPGSDTRSTYGHSLVSPTRQIAYGKLLDYHGYARKKGDRFLVHIKDQAARPDMFRIYKPPVVAPDVEIETLPEPALLVTEPAVTLEPATRRGRKPKK